MMWRIYSNPDPHGSPFSRLLRHARGCWGPIHTQIPHGEVSVWISRHNAGVRFVVLLFNVHQNFFYSKGRHGWQWRALYSGLCLALVFIGGSLSQHTRCDKCTRVLRLKRRTTLVQWVIEDLFQARSTQYTKGVWSSHLKSPVGFWCTHVY
jgi:hypothetical protein